MSRKLLTLFLPLLLVLISTSALAQSPFIFMESTGYPDSVAIKVTVNDPGGLPSCAALAVIRSSSYGSPGPIVGVFARQPGATIVRHIVDTDVDPNTEYCYGMALILFPVPVPLWCGGDVCQVWNCFCDISTCSNTGPDPFFIGHGLLSTVGGGGDTPYYLYDCSGGAVPIQGFCGISGTAASFLNSGIAVDVYGQPERCYAQCIWGRYATAATAQPCIVAVQPTSWGAVKALYRD